MRFSARLRTDTPGMLQAEAGEGFIDGSRYGDYAGEQLDTDGCTVWHLEEYAKAGALWETWIASTKFASCAPPPAPDFSLSAIPSSQTVTQGAGTSYTVNIARTGGFTGAVMLTASGTPTGANATFDPNNTVGNTSTMSLTTSSSTLAGSYVLTIAGVSSPLSHTTSVTLVVQTAVIRGTVKDAGGALVAGAWVHAYQGGTGAVCCNWMGGAASDSNGNYSFAVPAVTYKIWINPPAPFWQQWNGGPDFASATPIIVSGPTLVNITLHP